MNRSEISSERIVILFLLGILLFSPPFILIFDSPALVAGIPKLFLYLIIAWAALIALMMLVIEYTQDDTEQGEEIEISKEESNEVTDFPGEKI